MSTTAVQATSAATSTTTIVLAERDPTMERVHALTKELLDSCVDESRRRGYPRYPREGTRFVQSVGFVGGYDKILAYTKQHLFHGCRVLAIPKEGNVNQFLKKALGTLSKESARLRVNYTTVSEIYVESVTLISTITQPNTSCTLPLFADSCEKMKALFQRCLINPSKSGLYQDLERFQQLSKQLIPFICARDPSRSFMGNFEPQDGKIKIPNLFEGGTIEIDPTSERPLLQEEALRRFYEDLGEFVLIHIDYLNVMIHHAHQFWTLLDNVPEWLKKAAVLQKVLHPTIGEKNTLLVWDYC